MYSSLKYPRELLDVRFRESLDDDGRLKKDLVWVWMEVRRDGGMEWSISKNPVVEHALEIWSMRVLGGVLDRSMIGTSMMESDFVKCGHSVGSWFNHELVFWQACVIVETTCDENKFYFVLNTRNNISYIKLI